MYEEGLKNAKTCNFETNEKSIISKNLRTIKVLPFYFLEIQIPPILDVCVSNN